MRRMGHGADMRHPPAIRSLQNFGVLDHGEAQIV